MEKITVYSAIGGKLEKESGDFLKEAQVISSGMGGSLEDALQFLADLKGKRIVHYYPGTGFYDVSGLKFLCDIPDGGVYVG